MKKVCFLILLLIFSCFNCYQLEVFAYTPSNKQMIVKNEQWKVYDNLGWTYFRQDDYKNAILNFEKAKTELSKMPITHETKGEIDWYNGFIINLQDALEKGYLLDID